VGEIHLFAGNFAPSGWAFCDGSVRSVPKNVDINSVLPALGSIGNGETITDF
jgi:microcystin-dependent protein